MYLENDGVIYPFLYLDSSYILRNSWENLKTLSRAFSTKYPQKFHDVISRIEIESRRDEDYYNRIHKLLQQGVISTVITFETTNEIVKKSDPKIIALFGKVHNGNPESLILWGEDVDFKKYNQAATSILNAVCIVADSDFFKIAVGKSLAKYILSNSKLCIIAKHAKIPSLESDYIVFECTPKEFIWTQSLINN